MGRNRVLMLDELSKLVKQLCVENASFKFVLEHSNTAYALFEPDIRPDLADLKYTFANEAYRKLYGIGHDPVGESHYEVFPTLIKERPSYYEQNSAAIAGVQKVSHGLDSFAGVSFAWHVFPLTLDGETVAVVFEITPDGITNGRT